MLVASSRWFSSLRPWWRGFAVALLLGAVVAAPAVANEHKGGEEADATEADTSDSDDFRPCNGLAGNPEGSLAKTVSVGGVPIESDGAVPVGAQVEVTITWNTADFLSLDQLFDCVYVDSDGDGNALEDSDVRTDLSDKEKPPPNTGSHVHTYTVPDDAAGKLVCDRARLSGTPNDPPNVSTQKSNTFCFEAVDAVPIPPPLPAYRCEGASVDDPDATLRAYTDDDAVTAVSFALTRDGGPTTTHPAAAGSGGTWEATVEDLLPGTYGYEADFGEESAGGCTFTIGSAETPPVPADPVYSCDAPAVDADTATLNGSSDDASVDAATFWLTKDGETVATAHDGDGGPDGSWSVAVADLAPGGYTYTVAFADGDEEVATASDEACAFTIAAATPAAPAPTYACAAPTVSSQDATLRATTNDPDVDAATFRLTSGDGITTEYTGAGAERGDGGAWAAEAADLAAGDYTYTVEFAAGDAPVASAGPGDACRFTVAAAPAGEPAPAPRPSYTCAAPAVSGTSATLRGTTDDGDVDGATFHLTTGGVTTSHAATGGSGSWSAAVSDLAAGSYTYTVEFTDGGATVATAGPGGACRFSVEAAEPEPTRTYRCDPASGVTQTAAVLNATSDHPAVTSATFTVLQGSTVLTTLTDATDADGFSAQVTGLLPATAYSYTVEFDPGNREQTNAACGFTTDAATSGSAPTYGSLTVEKNSELGDGSFPVSIDCDGTQFDADLVVETTAGSGVVGPIANIPTGTACTVTEDVPTGWTATSAALQTVVVDGAEVIAFTNRRILSLSEPAAGNLSVGKVDTADPVSVGTAFDYVFTVHNTGTTAASGVVLADTLPDSVTPGAASPSQGTCSLAGFVLTCSLGSIPAGGSATVRITVTPTQAGTLDDTATVASSGADADPADDAAAEETVVRAAEVAAAGASGATAGGAAAGAAGAAAPGSSPSPAAGEPSAAVAGAGSAAPTLPATGASTLAGLATGALLIVTGSTIVEGTRRRQVRLRWLQLRRWRAPAS